MSRAIVLNNTTTPLTASNSGFYVSPIRNSNAPLGTILFYDITNKEIVSSELATVWSRPWLSGNFSLPENSSISNVYLRNTASGNNLFLSDFFEDINFQLTVYGDNNSSVTFDLACPLSKTATFYNMKTADQATVNSIELTLAANQILKVFNDAATKTNIYYRID